MGKSSIRARVGDSGVGEQSRSVSSKGPRVRSEYKLDQSYERDILGHTIESVGQRHRGYRGWTKDSQWRQWREAYII